MKHLLMDREYREWAGSPLPGQPAFGELLGRLTYEEVSMLADFVNLGWRLGQHTGTAMHGSEQYEEFSALLSDLSAAQLKALEGTR